MPTIRFDSSVEDRRGDAMHITVDTRGATMADHCVFVKKLNNKVDRRKWSNVGVVGGRRKGGYAEETNDGWEDG